MILNGKKVSKTILEEVKEQISKYDLRPGLGIIIVGDRPDSMLYVKMKKKCVKI